MMFKVGNNIQIIPGNDIYQSVYLCGFQYAGSTDDACTLAVAARGIGQVTAIEPMLASTNPGTTDYWVSVAWQLAPTLLLYKLPAQKFNQQAWKYSQEWLSRYFTVIS